ncbi:MAG: helix-turn-helix domain-containing protein, partial [Spirochaetaceae bacterium]|nr:helix-turn-helix domain-containing protein [Spirochaetaceae bacterium]
GARKIAFLRGPDFHQSAQARFEGYYDALKESGLVNGESTGGREGVSSNPLISTPHHWSAGDAAAAQLFEHRSLVPGRDFDTLIGSSDLMTLGAVHYFARQGYHVPHDYHATGFNNSAESRISECPLSTVRFPYTELADESFKILLRLLSRKKYKPGEDVLLNTELIIRESCGCVNFRGTGEKPHRGYFRETALSMPGSAEEGLIKMTWDYLKLDPADMNALALPVIHALFHEGPERFFPLFEKALIRFFNSGRESESLLKLIADAEAAGFISPEKYHRLEPALYRLIFKIREQLTAQVRYENEQWNTALNSLKCDLLGTRDRYSLVRSLARHLPKIGISTAAIVLYADEKTSICVGSFSPEGISPQRGKHFPARLLVPANLKGQYLDGIFMVQPLFIENQSLGYFVHNVPINNGLIFEELRSAVSYALKGIALLEETVKAKRIAEQTERAKAEFLRLLEDGLHDPLQGVVDRLEQLEQKVAESSKSVDIKKEIADLKAFVSSREAEVDNLMDLTLSRIDNLSLRRTIFDIDDLLPGIGTFPLLSGDMAHLAQCFSLVREKYGGENAADTGYSAALTYSGLAITFRGAKQGQSGRLERARQFGLLLAERIILIHGGDFIPESGHCLITLPWTTLTGQEPSKRPVNSQDYILMLSDPAFLAANFFTLPQIKDAEKAPSGRIAFIVWNAAGASPEELVKVVSLRRKSEFANVPFLCYGGEPGARENGNAPPPAASLIDAVEFALKSPKKGAILFIGPWEHDDKSLEQLVPAGGSELKLSASESPEKEISLEKIHIDSMTAFNETVGEISPSLIIFNTLNTAGAAAVRQHPLTVMVPIIMISDRIDNAGDVMTLSQYSRLVICHKAVALSTEFKARVKALISGDEILPPHTGLLVKKAILYFGQHAETHIFRWKLADSVNVSEDYLSRIFHREMGLSLWDYLNRCRIFLAAELLRRTDDTIQDIASRTGFQDQAYFCRVFKKIYGVPPGQIRKK